MNSYIYLLSLKNIISNPVVRNIKTTTNFFWKNRNSVFEYPQCKNYFAVNKIQLAKPTVINRFHSVSSSENIPKYKSERNIWLEERVTTLFLPACFVTIFIMPVTTIEFLSVLAVTTHIHWGLDAILIDYVRPAIFGEFIPKYIQKFTLIISSILFTGLMLNVIHGDGVIKIMKQLWYLDLNVDINPIYEEILRNNIVSDK